MIFLHDPTRSVHKKDETHKRPDAIEIDVVVAKQRNGPTGVIKLLFQSKYATFKNISKEAPPPWEAADDSDAPSWVDQDDDDASGFD